MGSGVLSCLIYALTLIFYRKHLMNVVQSLGNVDLERQKRVTKLVGFVTLVTFCCYVIPNLVILNLDWLREAKTFAKATIDTINLACYVMVNINSATNILIFGSAPSLPTTGLQWHGFAGSTTRRSSAPFASSSAAAAPAPSPPCATGSPPHSKSDHDASFRRP